MFADDMILYIENPKDSIRKFSSVQFSSVAQSCPTLCEPMNRSSPGLPVLELISEFSKIAGYNINTQKSLTFLYTNNEKSEREIKESIPFTIATKRINYLGIKLPKETKELYIENGKTLMKEIKDDIEMERDSTFLGRKNQYCENDYTT